MTGITIEVPGDTLARYANQLAMLSAGQQHTAIARALNDGGQKVYTLVKRALVEQTSIKYGDINRGVKTQQARPGGSGVIEFKIVGTGREFSLKSFRPVQRGYGVGAKVWGRTQRFPGAFMGPRPGVVADKLGGHVYKNTGGFNRVSGRNNAIARMWGPSIAKELVKDKSESAFLKNAPLVLDTIDAQIATILRGF